MLDRRVVSALTASPRISIPEGFAQRVAAEAVLRSGAGRRTAWRTMRYGPLAFQLALGLLIAAMVLAARFVTPGSTMLVESVLAAEFVALSVCAGLSPGILR